MKTIKRNWLKKQIELGKMEVKCKYHLTDDYAFDNAYGFGKTDWMPARIRRPKFEEYVNEIGSRLDRCTDEDSKDGFMNMGEYLFTGKSGAAYYNDNGTINLRVYSGLVYELRFTETKAQPEPIELPSRYALID